MILKVEIKRLLEKYIKDRSDIPSNWKQIVMELTEFADWLDELDIEKVIGI